MAEVRDAPRWGLSLGIGAGMFGIAALFVLAVWIARFGFRWPGR